MVLAVVGIGAWAVAASSQLLPHDVRYLGMSSRALCDLRACRIVHFMVHDRVSFGGSLIAIGVLYVWLAARPLAEGRPWAFWLFVLSGSVGFLSFLAYLGYGYLDVWHGRATLALLVPYLLGLVRSWPLVEGGADAGPRSLLRLAWRPPLRSRAGAGRALLLFTATGMLLGGATIAVVGMTRVFVPQDLVYMDVTADALRALNPRLVPLIAHDRAGFGGGLCCGGLTILFIVVCGVRPGARALWWVLLAAGTVGFASAIGIHPIVGYNSFSHLLPALVGATTFATGIALLRAPMCDPRPPA
jgi:hypothetical protein